MRTRFDMLNTPLIETSLASLLLSASVLASPLSPVEQHLSKRDVLQGECTFYLPNGGYGACGRPLQNTEMIAALSFEDHAKIGCGKCLRVYGPKGSVVVEVQDKCAGCKSGDVDLSHSAFLLINDESVGRFQTHSEIVDCSSGKAQGDMAVQASHQLPTQPPKEEPAPKPEPLKQEPVQKEPPKQEPPKQEPPTQEPPKQEPPMQEPKEEPKPDTAAEPNADTYADKVVKCRTRKKEKPEEDAKNYAGDSAPAAQEGDDSYPTATEPEHYETIASPSSTIDAYKTPEASSSDEYNDDNSSTTSDKNSAASHIATSISMTIAVLMAFLFV